MSTNAGIWIDHRNAVIVFLSDSDIKTKIVESDVEEQVEAARGARSSKPYGSGNIATSDRRDNRFTQLLDRYYDEVIDELKTVDNIFLVGPGEAKGEFQKRTKTRGLPASILAVEAADKMTQPQFVAKVKEFFGQE